MYDAPQPDLFVSFGAAMQAMMPAEAEGVQA